MDYLSNGSISLYLALALRRGEERARTYTAGWLAGVVETSGKRRKEDFDRPHSRWVLRFCYRIARPFRRVIDGDELLMTVVGWVDGGGFAVLVMRTRGGVVAHVVLLACVFLSRHHGPFIISQRSLGRAMPLALLFSGYASPQATAFMLCM